MTVWWFWVCTVWNASKMPSSCWPELFKFNKWPFFSLSFICNISAYLLFQSNFFSITKYCFLLCLLSLKYFCWAVWLHSSVQTTNAIFRIALHRCSSLLQRPWRHFPGCSRNAASAAREVQDISTLLYCLCGGRSTAEGRRHRERNREHSSALEQFSSSNYSLT